jgi:hypothetical protein
MGIRIKRMLGYGLVDVKCEQYRIVDERFNPDSVLFADYQEREEEFNKEKYLAFCEKHSDGFEFDLILEIMELKKKDCRWDYYDSFKHDGEYGLPHVLCILPACCPDWYQHDNIIDYYTANLEAKKTRNYCACSVEVMEDGIYPWNASFIDKRTGKRIDSVVACAFLRLVNAQRDAEAAGKPKNLGYDMDVLAKVCGFESAAEAMEFMRPKVPDVIVNLCRFGKLFKDEATIRDLVPMLYTYWS